MMRFAAARSAASWSSLTWRLVPRGQSLLRDKASPDSIGWKCLASGRVKRRGGHGAVEPRVLSAEPGSSWKSRHRQNGLGAVPEGLKPGAGKRPRLSRTRLWRDTTRISQDLICNGDWRRARWPRCLRAGAKPGDLIFVSGRLGGSRSWVCRRCVVDGVLFRVRAIAG